MKLSIERLNSLHLEENISKLSYEELKDWVDALDQLFVSSNKVDVVEYFNNQCKSDKRGSLMEQLKYYWIISSRDKKIDELLSE